MRRAGGAPRPRRRMRGSQRLPDVQPWTLTASLYPGAQWAGIADKHVVAMARVTTTHKAIAAGVLAGASLLVAVAETAASWTRWEQRRRLFQAADGASRALQGSHHVGHNLTTVTAWVGVASPPVGGRRRAVSMDRTAGSPSM